MPVKKGLRSLSQMRRVRFPIPKRGGDGRHRFNPFFQPLGRSGRARIAANDKWHGRASPPTPWLAKELTDRMDRSAVGKTPAHLNSFANHHFVTDENLIVTHL